MTLIDEFTRECLAIRVARRINSFGVIETTADVMLERGVPEHIRSDNGAEMTAKIVRGWFAKLGATTLYIEPGSPWENGYCESFNGKLPVTFDDFVRYGINRQQIAPAIRECEALGFLEVTERGRAGNAEFRTPNLFRLTYVYAAGTPPTHDWRKIETIEGAQWLASAARKAKGMQAKKQNPSAAKQTGFSAGNQHRKAQIHSTETSTTVIVPKPTLPGGEALREWSTPTLTEITMDEYSAKVSRKRGKPVLRIAN
jgi:Integrase core domain